MEGRDGHMENKDLLLLSFVNSANNHGLEIGVTLNVSGTIISGELIGYSSYLKLLASEFYGKGEVAEALSQTFFERAIEAENDQAESEDTEIKPANFLHLKNATISYGQHTTKIGLWRNRISSVNGFTFGVLQQN